MCGIITTFTEQTATGKSGIYSPGQLNSTMAIDRCDLEKCETQVGYGAFKLGLSKIPIGSIFILYSLGRCRRKTGIPDPEVRVPGEQNELTRGFFFLFLFFGWTRPSHFPHMPTCKGHESYGRIIPSVLELWYARDIVLDLIVTRHKYPLDPGNQEPPILLCLWRTSSTNAKSIPSLLMVILIISFPLPSQNSKKAKTIHHHGAHLTLFHPPHPANQPPVSHIIPRTKFRLSTGMLDPMPR